VSSQYASALLLIAPRIGGLTLELLQRPVSRPYLELTLDVLASFGIETGAEGLDAPGGRLRVAAGVPRATVYRVEADASCAAPWWTAAVVTGGTVVVEGLPRATRQADARLLPILERVGATAAETASGGLRVGGPEGGIAGLRALGDVDLKDASDLVPLVGALAAVAPGRTRIHGAAHVRFKESDRLQTVADGIRALGGTADVTETGELVVEGTALSGGVVSAAADHRLVLAFGVLGLAIPGVVIRGAEAVSKSYPSFLAELGAFGGEGRGEG
jgi:3-phosphoshikimate 1-carboxyvinyltransferase